MLSQAMRAAGTPIKVDCSPRLQEPYQQSMVNPISADQGSDSIVKSHFQLPRELDGFSIRQTKRGLVLNIDRYLDFPCIRLPSPQLGLLDYLSTGIIITRGSVTDS